MSAIRSVVLFAAFVLYFVSCHGLGVGRLARNVRKMTMKLQGGDWKRSVKLGVASLGLAGGLLGGGANAFKSTSSGTCC